MTGRDGVATIQSGMDHCLSRFFPIVSSSPSLAIIVIAIASRNSRLPPLPCGVQEVGSDTMPMPRRIVESRSTRYIVFNETRGGKWANNVRNQPGPGRSTAERERENTSIFASQSQMSGRASVLASGHEAAGRTLGETLIHPRLHPADRTRASGISVRVRYNVSASAYWRIAERCDLARIEPGSRWQWWWYKVMFECGSRERRPLSGGRHENIVRLYRDRSLVRIHVPHVLPGCLGGELKPLRLRSKA